MYFTVFIVRSGICECPTATYLQYSPNFTVNVLKFHTPASGKSADPDQIAPEGTN